MIIYYLYYTTKFSGILKPFGFLKGDQLVCYSHGWLSPRHVLVATERGKILLFEDAELKSTYAMEELTRTEEPDLEKEAGAEAREVGALMAYSGGFIASYGQDMVFVFEQIASETGEEFNFKCIKRIKFPKVRISIIRDCTYFVYQLYLASVLSTYEAGQSTPLPSSVYLMASLILFVENNRGGRV